MATTEHFYYTQNTPARTPRTPQLPLWIHALMFHEMLFELYREEEEEE